MRKVFKIITIIILFFLSLTCNRNPTGEKKMEEKNIASQLKDINIMETNKLDAISKDIEIESRKDAIELVKILHLGKDEEAKKAAMILMSIGDLSITPMLESIDTNNADNYAWEMDIVLSRHLQNRNKISIILNSMFLDKRLLKGPDLKGPVEEKPLPRRVCDEAYLMLRRLTAYKENDEDMIINERMFLNMSDIDKDKEIQRLKSSKEWISLSEHFNDQGEF